jgi:hypothetical protein
MFAKLEISEVNVETFWDMSQILWYDQRDCREICFWMWILLEQLKMFSINPMSGRIDALFAQGKGVRY